MLLTGCVSLGRSLPFFLGLIPCSPGAPPSVRGEGFTLREPELMQMESLNPDPNHLGKISPKTRGKC